MDSASLHCGCQQTPRIVKVESIVKVIISYGFPSKRRIARIFGRRRCFLLSALRSALQFYALVAFIFFTPILGGLYFDGVSPDGLNLARAFGLFVAGEMCFPSRRIIVIRPREGFSRDRWIALLLRWMVPPALVLRFFMRTARGARMRESGWQDAHSSRAGADIGALIAGIAFGLVLGSRGATTVTTEYAASQAAVFALRIALIAGGGGGLLAVYLRRFLCDTSSFVKLAWCRTLAHMCPAMHIVRRACPRRRTPIETIEGDIK
jgi:hypothetical protein